MVLCLVTMYNFKQRGLLKIFDSTGDVTISNPSELPPQPIPIKVENEGPSMLVDLTTPPHLQQPPVTEV